jgi:hypothetical protein
MTSIIKSFGVLTGVIIVIALVVLMPFAYIWAVNTLFGLTIETSFETWCAVIILQMFFHNNISIKGK